MPWTEQLGETNNFLAPHRVAISFLGRRLIGNGNGGDLYLRSTKPGAPLWRRHAARLFWQVSVALMSQYMASVGDSENPC